MRVRLLGPLLVEVDGDPVAVRGAKERGILALLAARANQVVSGDTLIDELWGEQAPPSAKKSLQSYLTRLRDHLEPNRKPGAGGTRIESLHGGYRLVVGLDELDLLEFDDLVRTGHDSLRAGAPATAYSMLSDALDLWRGGPFQGFDGFLIETETSHFRELRRQAFEDRVEAGLLLGRHREVITDIEAELVTDPFRESLWRQLMVALYRSGRQAEAVAAFDRARITLLELGLEPSRELQITLELILNQDPSLDGPHGETNWLPAGNMSVGSVFAGRDAERAELLSWWPPRGPTLGWVFGADGIGKTRLVVEAASALRDRGVPILYGSGDPASSDPLRSLRRAFAAVDGNTIPDGAWLERRFGQDGLLVILDDVDPGNVRLANTLDVIKEQVAMPLLVLLLSETPADDSFAPLIGDRRLELGPLSVDDVNRIVESHVGEEGRLDRTKVYLQSGGVPAAVHHIVLEWAQQHGETRLATSLSSVAEQHRLIRQTGAQVLDDIAHLQRLELLDSLRTQSVDLQRPPYRGLARYDIDDAALFFGREEDVRHLILKLAEGGLVGLVGPSGCGKSSLVRAGLVAAARRGIVPGGPWMATVIIPGPDPMTQLTSLVGGGQEHGGERRLLVVDQLEQLFIACPDPAARVEFLDALARIPHEHDAPVVVAVLRADYYGHVSISSSFSHSFADGTVIVGPMSAEQMHRCIELPAKRHGIEIAPGLISLLVTDSVGQPGALPLLSTTLLELCEARRGSTINISDYLRSGGLEGAVARLAEETYQALDPQRQAILRRVLLRLAGPGESDTLIARRVPTSIFESDETEEVIRILIEDRLLTSEEDAVTVAHESLFREWPRLVGWLEEDRLGREIHQHLIEAASFWEEGGEREEDLYRGARLAAAAEWGSSEPERLTKGEEHFLRASQNLAERTSRETEERARQAESTSRRLRRLAAAVLAVAMVAVAASVFANVQRSQARSEAEAALATSLGAQALQQEHIDLSLLLAVQARHVVDSGAAKGSLLRSILRAPQALGVMRSGAERLTNVAISPEGDVVASVSADARLDLWSTDDQSFVATLQNEGDWGPASSLAFSPDGNTVAVAEEWGRPTGAVRLWDIASRLQTQVIELPIFSPVISFSPDGGELLALDIEGGLHHIDPREGRVTRSEERVVAVADGGMNLGWSRDTGTLVVSSAREAVIRASGGDVRIATGGWALPSPNGSLLGVANLDGEVYLVDARNGETLRELRGHSAAIDDLEFTPDGGHLVTSSRDGTVMVWDVATGQAINTFRGHAGRVTGVAVDPAGEMVYSSGLDGALVAWDLTASEGFGGRPWTLDAHVGGAALVSGGDRIAALSEDGPTLVDISTGKSQTIVEGDFWALATTPARPLVAVAGETGLVIDTTTGATITGPVDLRPDGVGWIAVLPDGSLAVTSPAGLRVWAQGEPEPTHLSSTKMWGLTASDDGSLLAAGQDDGSVVVWATKDWTQVSRIPPAGHEDPVLGLRFNPSTTTLLTYAIEGPIREWAIETGQQITEDLTGHSGFVLDTSFSPSGASMISVGSDGKVGLWDTSTWRLTGVLPGPPATWGWGWFLDETRIVTLFEDGSSREWSANPNDWEMWACRVAGRRLTEKEWNEFLTGRPYDPAC